MSESEISAIRDFICELTNQDAYALQTARGLEAVRDVLLNRLARMVRGARIAGRFRAPRARTTDASSSAQRKRAT
jgi:hypothetical protein